MPLVLNGTTGVQDNSGAFVLGTAVNSTSGTSIDFTSIPSWVKRVTVCFNGVSTNGSSIIQVQIGAGSFATSGYQSVASFGASAAGYYGTSTTAFIVEPSVSAAASFLRFGSITLTTLGSNIWVESGNTGSLGVQVASASAGNITLSGTLDRVRITTQNGTDTFDAGSINILYE